MRKTFSITLQDERLGYVEHLVKEGKFDSVEAFVDALIVDRIAFEMYGKPGPDHLAETVESRLDLPLDEWIPWDGKQLLEDLEVDLQRHLARKKRAAE